MKIILVTTCDEIIKFLFLFQSDWLAAQVYEKDVWKYTTTAAGGLCVVMDLVTRKPELFVTRSDTGRILSSRQSFTQNYHLWRYSLIKLAQKIVILCSLTELQTAERWREP